MDRRDARGDRYVIKERNAIGQRAIPFLYEVVLGRRVAWMNDIVRAQRPVRLPVVLSRDQVSSLLSRLRGPVWLMAP